MTPTTTASDEHLVAAVRTGDDRAYEHLYERYHRRITAYVLGMVSDHGRAEDLTQEIFIAALRRMRQTDRAIAFKPWIYEIAKNACIDQYRRSRRTDEVSFDAESFDAGRLSVESDTPDAAVDTKQQLSDLCGAFGGLSETHHQILVLRELEGLSYREIGERLGMSRPSVESTLFRARRRLGEEYDELVSGERCRSVQALLVSGARIGRREERRVARHVAHCQPCRREALQAGVGVAPLPAERRRAALGRVAAALPLPAFLRFKRPGAQLDSHVAQWSQSVSTVAEPAVTWGKAIACTAAVLVAGGAGAVGHDSGSPRGPVKAATSHPAPLHQPAIPRPAKVPDTGPAKTRHARPAPAARSGGTAVPRRSHTPTVPRHVAKAPRVPAADPPPTTVTPKAATDLPQVPEPELPAPTGHGPGAGVPDPTSIETSTLPLPPEASELLDRAALNLHQTVESVDGVQTLLGGSHR